MASTPTLLTHTSHSWTDPDLPDTEFHTGPLTAILHDFPVIDSVVPPDHHLPPVVRDRTRDRKHGAAALVASIAAVTTVFAVVIVSLASEDAIILPFNIGDGMFAPPALPSHDLPPVAEVIIPPVHRQQPLVVSRPAVKRPVVTLTQAAVSPPMPETSNPVITTIPIQPISPDSPSDTEPIKTTEPLKTTDPVPEPTDPVPTSEVTVPTPSAESESGQVSN